MPIFNKYELSETDIRSKYITPSIQNAGWDLITQVREEYAITPGKIMLNDKECKRESPLKADYVLFYKSNEPIAVIEAKDNKHSIGAGIQQALNYAKLLDIPFVFSSNGDGFLFHNKYDTKNRERELSLNDFPSPNELWNQYIKHNNFNQDQLKIINENYYTDNPNKQPRYYQRNAINKTVEAIAGGKKRLLLVMATGTGKTYTAFQIIWRLWKAGIKKRILFLADRTALIQQTVTNDFAPFKDAMTWVTKDTFDTAHEIYLGLYQGLTGGDNEYDVEDEHQAEEDKKLFKKFSKGFFDLIVVDECHRGSAKANSRWREILTYFDSATHIGMTATPKETDDISTSTYFGEPIYLYSLKDGINDGFLAPYRVLKYEFDIDKDGYTPDVGAIDDYGSPIERRTYNVRDYDRVFVPPNRTKTIAKIVSDYLKENNCRMDKSIFFCMDQEHAARMREALVNENPDMVNIDEHYVMRITSDDKIGNQWLDNFRNVNEKYPVLVTTSKLLTTGVDVPTVKYIILDSNIQSQCEFKQIIGRGTRVREDLGKLYFTIFDFRNVTALFHDPDFDGPIDNSGYIGPKIKDKPPIISPNEKKPKYYVSGIPVNVKYNTVEYIDENGNTVLCDLIDYTKITLTHRYASYKDFFAMWTAAERKEKVIHELEEQCGIFWEELQNETNLNLDPFDLICHIAYGKPPLTRKERADNVRKKNYFTKYGKQAAEVLDAILTKYCDNGLSDLENIDVVKVAPINNFGTQLHIVNNIFGGKDQYLKAIMELENELYAEA